jgi:1-acyl-sn-glycerol-3-phosphate acyltransferase
VIRRIIVAILRLTLRIYFRRIEIAGLEHVPRTSPAIFVLNHPNALVDPVFLLCLVPRKVCFLAKAPLFRMPVLGYFVRALDALPAYRHQDQGADVSKNQETFAAARRLLARGATIGICPEGASHDDPSLRPIKTGAARIALGAVSTGEVRDLKIIPAGLYYTSKTTFRSAALLYFGNPINVTPVELEANGELPREPVRELSNQIENAMRAVVLEALQRIKGEKSGKAEEKHRHAIGDPMLLVFIVDAADAINSALDWPEHRRKPRALAIENARQITAKRLGDGDDDHAV